MNNFDINTILDSEWISNILGISFALFFLFVGLPVVYLQTYSPEIRKYYFHFRENNMLLIKKSILLLLPIIVLFGNQEVKYIIDKLIFSKDSFILKIGQISIDEEIFSIIYYSIALIYFLFFLYKLAIYFKDSIHQIEDVKVLILNSIFQEINSTSNLKEAHLNTLIDLSSIFSSSYDRNEYLKSTFDLILNILKKQYGGSETKIIYQNIFVDIFIKDFENCSYNNLNDLISLTKNIGKKYQLNNNLNSTDSLYISNEFIPKLCFKLIDISSLSLVTKCLICLKELNTSQNIFLEIFTYAFEKKAIILITSEIGYLSKKILFDTSLEKDTLILYQNNLIAYLSLLYKENEMTKKYVLTKFEQVKSIGKRKGLKKSDFVEAKEYFYSNYKFDIANNVNILSQNIFKS